MKSQQKKKKNLLKEEGYLWGGNTWQIWKHIHQVTWMKGVPGRENSLSKHGRILNPVKSWWMEEVNPPEPLKEQ